MSDLFKKYPLATVIGWAVSVLAVLVALQETGVLTGELAKWVNTAVILINVLLTAYAKRHVTPVANPRDNAGRKLAPQRPGGAAGGW